MVECTLSITHCLRLNLQLHTIDLVRTCCINSFCTVAWQLARFQLTRRIARSLGDSWASCSNVSTFVRAYDAPSNSPRAAPEANAASERFGPFVRVSIYLFVAILKRNVVISRTEPHRSARNYRMYQFSAANNAVDRELRITPYRVQPQMHIIELRTLSRLDSNAAKWLTYVLAWS